MQIRNVGGQKFSFQRSGQGTPSVILETGLGAESSDWTQVEEAASGFATVFRYDRLGRGGSDASSTPRDALAMVTDLRRLLDAADVPPPYLFVGHSFGGLLAQIFAHRYRDEMLGVVLVESVHPAQFETLGPAFPGPAPDEPQQLSSMRRFWTEAWKDSGSTQEKIDFQTSFAQAPGPNDLDGLPLHVMSTGSFLHIPFLSAAVREALQSRWLTLQSKLLDLSAEAMQSYWPASSHFIQRENPHAIVAVIRDLRGSSSV